MINKFRGEYAFLSNFSAAPVTFDNRIWPTVEHAFQAAKVDKDTADKIYFSTNPSVAKRLGRTGTMRADWDTVREDIMLACLRSKFLDNPVMKQKLLATGDEELVEGNFWHDNYWGVCECPKCQEKNITGGNMLGKLLMQVRDEAKTS